MSTSTGALQTTYPGQKRANKRTFNRRFLLTIERSKPTNEDDRLRTSIPANTPNANMADHSVGAWDEVHESEASEASVFVLTMLPLKSLLSWMV